MLMRNWRSTIMSSYDRFPARPEVRYEVIVFRKRHVDLRSKIHGVMADWLSVPCFDAAAWFIGRHGDVVGFTLSLFECSHRHGAISLPLIGGKQ